MELKPGYKQTEVGVIPSDWDVSTVGNLFRITAGGDVDRKRSQSFFDEVHRYPIYSNALTNLGLYGYCSYADHPKGSLTITARGMVGHANFRNHDYTAIGRVLVLQPNVKVAGVYFAELINNTINFADESTGVPQLTAPQISKYQLPVPSFPEQQAIAEALSDADALIESLDQLIAKKRQIKQGAMQELLTGKRRLPGFGGEWVIKRLGDVAEISKGQLITESTAIPGDVPVIAGGKKPAYFHNRANRTGKTITISGSGASAGYVAFYESPIFASDCSTIGGGGNYSVEFIYFVLLLNQEVIYKAQTGGAQPHIHPDDLRPLMIHVPLDCSEQAAIATILSDMDTELAALESRLAKARQIKQGMMQELLTGRIRLL